MITDLNKLAAEFIGTFTLVFIGTAVATLHGFLDYGDAGWPMIASAFAGTLAILVIVIGPVSGCHVNPAVTIPMALAGRLAPRLVVPYILAQLLGAAAGSAALWGIAATIPGYELGLHGLGANANPHDIAVSGLLALEILMTALFLLVIFAATRPGTPRHESAAAIGGILFLAHLVGAPLGDASLNPARSIGPALFSGGDALAILWLFIAGPILGGILGWLIYKFVFPPENA